MNIHDAIKLAELEIQKRNNDPFFGGFVIMPEFTKELKCGWLFSYAPRKLIETKDIRYMLIGAGPVLVDRNDGSIHFFSSSPTGLKKVEEYEEQWIIESKKDNS